MFKLFFYLGHLALFFYAALVGAIHFKLHYIALSITIPQPINRVKAIGQGRHLAYSKIISVF
jgi:hypothetical protein